MAEIGSSIHGASAGASLVSGFREGIAQREAGLQELASTQSELRALSRRDTEVRAHELAHAAIGGVHASAPQFEFTRGPNGVSYAVAGHVNIDVAPVPGDPAATLKKMQVVQRAAMAPAQPSSADRAVAARASAQAAQARAELAAMRELEADTYATGADDSGLYNSGQAIRAQTGAQVDVYA